MIWQIIFTTIILCLFTARVQSQLTCTSDSECGLAGICPVSGGYCICGSNYQFAGGSCTETPCLSFNLTTGANNTNNSLLLQPELTTNFATGKWEIFLAFDTLYNARRNVRILSMNGTECANFLTDRIASSVINIWSQAVNCINSPSCTDQINGTLSWTSISSCIRNNSSPNYYQANIVVNTTAYSIEDNQGSLEKRNPAIGKREDSCFTYERVATFNFETQFVTSSNSTEFYLIPQIAVSFQILSSIFDSSALTLTVIVSQSVTAPIFGNISDVTVLTTSGVNTTFITSAQTCSSATCDQQTTIVFNLNTTSCSGYQDQVVLKIGVSCQSSSPLCPSLLQQLGTDEITIPFSISANWCPTEQTTGVQATGFSIYSNGDLVNNQQVLIGTRSVEGEIDVSVTNKVVSSVLSNATITQLLLSDGTNSDDVSSSIQQSFSNAGTSFTVNFNYSIPDIVGTVNLTNNLFFIATIDVVYGAAKKRISIERSINVGDIGIQATSTSFKLSNSPTKINNNLSTSTSSTSSSNPSYFASRTVGTALGLLAVFFMFS